MSVTTIMGMVFLFCATAEHKGPESYRWIFEGIGDAVIGVGLVAAADANKRRLVATPSSTTVVNVADRTMETTKE